MKARGVVIKTISTNPLVEIGLRIMFEVVCFLTKKGNVWL